MSGRLFRNTVELSAKADLPSPPPSRLSPPGAPALFGIADAATKVLVHMVMAGRTMAEMLDRCVLEVTFAGLSDDVGTVLAVNLTLTAEDGRELERASMMIAQPEAERIGKAISAIFQLTPEPGGTTP